MNTTLFGILAVLAYLSASGALIHSLQTDYMAKAEGAWQRWPILFLGWLAIALHAGSLLDMCDRAGTVNFSFLSVSSLAGLSIVVLLLLAALSRPVDKLGVIIFPLNAAIVFLKVVVPEEAHALKVHSWQMDVHILVSMLAYSFLNMAALQAVLLALQDWHLRSHHAKGVIRSLPPLQTMEKLLFQLIGAGFVLLSLSLITGFLFVDNLFAQHLVHKTVLSLFAWGVFGILLAGRFTQGWRGQIAIRWTLGGFVSLMLGYFGSKLVLEWILDKP